MTKIFPAIFLFYFLRKRDVRALVAAAITLALTTALSVYVFGWPLHRTYLEAILPSALRGETLPPYVLASGSLSSLLHRLFLYEPQWNPHPWLNAPLAAAILGPLVQTLILAPAILLVSPTRDRIALEWSALLAATLTISTIPASYNFTLLVFPLLVLLEFLRPLYALGAVLLFLAISYPGWNTASGGRPACRAPRSAPVPADRLHRSGLRHARDPVAPARALEALVVRPRRPNGARHLQRYPPPAKPLRRLPLPPCPCRPQPCSPPPHLPVGRRSRCTPKAMALRPGPNDQLSYLATPHGLWIEQAGATSTPPRARRLQRHFRRPARPSPRPSTATWPPIFAMGGDAVSSSLRPTPPRRPSM